MGFRTSLVRTQRCRGTAAPPVVVVVVVRKKKMKEPKHVQARYLSDD